MNRKQVFVSIFIIVIFIGVCAYILGFGRSATDTAVKDESGVLSEEIKEKIQGGRIESVAVDKELYRNDMYGFTLEVPKGTAITLLQDLEGDVLLFRTENSEFQMFIALFDETGPITADRIQQDLPNLLIREPQHVLIGGATIDALIFLGGSDDFGETREVWFAYGGHLYQVIAKAGEDEFIGPIMESLRFE